MTTFFPVTKEEFQKNLNRVASKFQCFLSPVSDNVDYFLDELHTCGFGVNIETKEIVGVHKLHNSIIPVEHIFRSAIGALGGNWVNCYDGFLANKYRELGFTLETERLTFSDEYAPSNWDYDRWGRPDVISLSLEKR